MKRVSMIIGAVALFVLVLAGCSLFNGKDVIVGRWQQVSVAGIPVGIVTVVEFTDNNTYTGTTGGVATNTGTWRESHGSYTLTGVFFGFIASTSTIDPTFSNSNNTMTYTDGSSLVEVYNRL
jgi:hypothetical protein